MKSFRPKHDPGDPPSSGRNQEAGSAAARQGRNQERDFHGERRANDSHASTTDPDARLYRKGPGQEAKLCFVGHVLMENRHGLVVDAELTRASGHAERLAALAMLDRLPTVSPITLAADRGFDARDFVRELRERRVTPHIAQNTSGRRSAIDAGPPATPAMVRASGSGSASRSLRVDQGHRRSVQDQAARPRAGALVVHARGRRLQPRTAAEAAGNQGSLAVTVPMDCRLIGRGGSSRPICGIVPTSTWSNPP